jgi:hypothetical protein
MFKANKPKSLNEIATCQKCKKFLIEPILLPCGKNICNKHVREATSKDEELLSVYKCEICHDNHKLPDKGFTVNESMVETMALNLHLGEKTRQAQSIINELDAIVNELKLICIDPDKFIYEYVNETISKIDRERNRLMLQIENVSGEMVTRIKSFENECKSKLKSSENIASNQFVLRSCNY